MVIQKKELINGMVQNQERLYNSQESILIIGSTCSWLLSSLWTAGTEWLLGREPASVPTLSGTRLRGGASPQQRGHGPPDASTSHPPSGRPGPGYLLFSKDKC